MKKSLETLVSQVQTDRVGELEEAQYTLKRLIAATRSGNEHDIIAYGEELSEVFSSDTNKSNPEAIISLAEELDNLNSILRDGLLFEYEDYEFKNDSIRIRWCVGQCGFKFTMNDEEDNNTVYREVTEVTDKILELLLTANHRT